MRSLQRSWLESGCKASAIMNDIMAFMYIAAGIIVGVYYKSIFCSEHSFERFLNSITAIFLAPYD